MCRKSTSFLYNHNYFYNHVGIDLSWLFFLIVNIILHVHVCTCNKCNFIWKSGSQTKLNRLLSRKTRSFLRVANVEGRRVGLSVLLIVNRRVQNHANAAYSGIFLISLQVETRGVWREIGENAWSVLYYHSQTSVCFSPFREWGQVPWEKSCCFDLHWEVNTVFLC